MLVAEAFADGGQAHSVLDKGHRVAVAELVQSAFHIGFSAVGRPARLNGLVAERLTVAVLHRSEQRPVPRFGFFEVAPEQADELWVVEQHRAPLPALAENVQVFVVAGQIEIVHIELERLTAVRVTDPAGQRPPMRLALVEGEGGSYTLAPLTIR